MPGVEAERTPVDGSGIGLLPYFQSTTTAAWATHTAQHAQEDKALDLAFLRVQDSAQALDKALALALVHVNNDQAALRELLQGRVDALSGVVDHNRSDADLRVQEARRALEQLTIEQHQAATQRVEGEWAAHFRAHQIQDDALHEQLTAYRDGHVIEHRLVQLAVEKAEVAVNVRLEAMNDLRGQITGERAGYITRDMLDARMATSVESQQGLTVAMQARVSALERTQNISFGVTAVLVFLIPIALRFIPGAPN